MLALAESPMLALAEASSSPTAMFASAESPMLALTPPGALGADSPMLAFENYRPDAATPFSPLQRVRMPTAEYVALARRSPPGATTWEQAPTGGMTERQLAAEAIIVAQITKENAQSIPAHSLDYGKGNEYDSGSDEEDSDESSDEGPSLSKKKTSSTASARARSHLADAEAGFCGFRCRCAAARRQGNDSCLQAFTVAELRSIHRDIHGESDAVHVSASAVGQRIHQKYWDARVPLPEPDSIGRTFSIGELTLGGKHVCHASFERALGGSRNAHKERMGLVLRGYSPGSLSVVQEAKIMLKLHEDAKGVHYERATFARNWWADELQLHDWLPNENAIQFKGPYWQIVHKECYEPAASACSGMPPLSYKAWKKQMLSGARQLAELLKDCRDVQGLRVRRSARHSKFPECTECQRRRAEYLKVVSNPGSSEAARAEKLTALKEHMGEWQEDRACALRLKDHSSGKSREWCYECDDKCGSHWCECPVAPGGRDNKANAKTKFKFAVQCNVIVGGGGVNRFMVVPKHVRTGGNFGITCLVLALYRAYELGRFSGPHAGRSCYRHTDGGPDNVNLPTHLFHWLIVYLGIFQDFYWFRFDAGHSHTELADRFFAMLKRLFDIDGRARPKRMDSLLEFEKRLRATFKDSAETAELDYLFANWDMKAWFSDAGFSTDHNFQGIDSANVFRYTYDEALWKHGCVKVTYKDRLSQKASELECEWKPIRRVTDAQKRERNVTTDEGVLYVIAPPRVLLSEPHREDYEDGASGNDVAKDVRQLVSKRKGHPEELTTDATDHWHALADLFAKGNRPGELPDLPVQQGDHAFGGCPRPLLPLLKKMRRFERPFIYWDPFNDEPPPTFPDRETAQREQTTRRQREAGMPPLHPAAQAHKEAEQHQPNLRDPRVANTVTGIHLPKTQAQREDREVECEQWADNFASKVPVNRIETGHLYLVQLTKAEHGFKLGFAEAGRPGDSPDTREALWFACAGKSPSWTDNAEFRPYRRTAKQDQIACEAFLMEVDKAWLTEASKADPKAMLRLQVEFVRKIRALVKLHPDAYGDDVQPQGGCETGSGSEEAADGLADPVQPTHWPSVDDIKEMSVNALREELRRRQLDEKGLKAVLQQRLLDAHAAANGSAGPRTPEQPAEEGPALRHSLQLRSCAGLDFTVLPMYGRAILPHADALLTLMEGGVGSFIALNTAQLRIKKASLVHVNARSLVLFDRPGSGPRAFITYRCSDSGFGFVYELHVHSSLRRKGVGAALLQDAEADMVAQGRSSSRLEVHVDNQAARQFYRSRGYSPACRLCEAATYEAGRDAPCADCGTGGMQLLEKELPSK